MLDKNTIIDDGQTIFCPDCEADYRMVWSENRNEVFIVCDCYEAENIQQFVSRFLGKHADGVTEEPDDGVMYQ